MKKTKELLYLTGCQGGYTAHIYDNKENRYEEQYFMFYSKREMIYLLRNKYNVICKQGTF